MTSVLGRFIHKIFSTVQQNIFETYQYRTLFRKPPNNELSPYIIVRATKDDHLGLLKLMHQAYFNDEPTCYSLGITRNAFLDERAMIAMAEGFTLLAKCKYDGSIVGGCINESTHCWDPDMTEEMACSVRCHKVKKLLLFYAHLQRLPDVWKKYNVDKVFEISMSFVQKNHRKKGIGLRLMVESRNTAADYGFKLIRCDATSAHTARLCEKMQMKKIGEIPYASYLSRSMEPIFIPPHPHDAVKIYIDYNPQIKKKIKESKSNVKKHIPC